MNLKNEICSLELSKRLKELGVKQDSLFYRFGDEMFQYIYCKYYEQYSPHVNLDIRSGFSAFTVAELGEMLPTMIPGNDKDTYIQYFKAEKWVCCFLTADPFILNRITESETEANARAKMLIYLLENKLMELPNE